jgi:hypothetical protein
MRELLIVVGDFYITDAGERAFANDRSGLPGLSAAVRFGVTSKVERGWRAWLAEWLGQRALADAAPASVASAAAPGRSAIGVVPVAHQHPHASPFAWIAQPVHLITGMRSVHLDHAGLLHPDADTQAQLVESFTREFASSPFHLASLPCGSFLMSGPEAASLQTSDPARYLGSSIEGSTPSGADAASLQRLVAEMEMWLHEHPVNRARARVRQRSINALWLWGGGPPLTPESTSILRSEVKQAVFGDDPYLDGLVALGVAERVTNASPVTADLSQILSTNADRVAVVVEAYRLPESSSISTPLQALEDIDRRWIAPAVQTLEQVHIIANDKCVTLRSKDRRKFWRRPREALAAFQ